METITATVAETTEREINEPRAKFIEEASRRYRRGEERARNEDSGDLAEDFAEQAEAIEAQAAFLYDSLGGYIDPEIVETFANNNEEVVSDLLGKGYEFGNLGPEDLVKLRDRNELLKANLENILKGLEEVSGRKELIDWPNVAHGLTEGRNIDSDALNEAIESLNNSARPRNEQLRILVEFVYENVIKPDMREIAAYKALFDGIEKGNPLTHQQLIEMRDAGEIPKPKFEEYELKPTFGEHELRAAA